MSNKRKVLIISGVFVPEPVVSARLNYDMAEALSEKYDVTVITPRPSRPYGVKYENIKPIQSGFKHIIVDSYTCPKSDIIGRLRESFSFAKATLRYIRQNNITADIIYNSSWHLIGLFMIARYAVKNNIPYIVPVQDIYPESLIAKIKKRRLLSKLIKLLALPIDRYYLSNATCIRTISDEMANYLAQTRKIARNKFVIVNNWQDDSIFEEQRPNEFGDILKFAYVGSVNDSSNVEHIIASYVDADIANSQLLIYGDGPNKEGCIQLANNLKIESIFFDSVTPEQVPSVEWSSNVLVLALKKGVAKTALPSKLTAYFLAGRPILASLDEDSAAAQIIKSYNCGIVVPPEDEEKLAQAFEMFANMEKDELARLGNNSRLCAEHMFLKSTNLQKITDVISSIIE